MKNPIESLTAGQLSALRSLVNEKQDSLFATLQTVTAQDAAQHPTRDARAQGLRDNLRFWDEIDRVVRDAHGII